MQVGVPVNSQDDVVSHDPCAFRTLRREARANSHHQANENKRKECKHMRDNPMNESVKQSRATTARTWISICYFFLERGEVLVVECVNAFAVERSWDRAVGWLHPLSCRL